MNHPLRQGLPLPVLLLGTLAAVCAPVAGADPVAALDGGVITSVEAWEELPRRDRRDLKFAFDSPWEDAALGPLMRELERIELLPPGARWNVSELVLPEGVRVDRPVHLRIVMTRAEADAEDKSERRSEDTFVRLDVEFRLELYLPGEDVPRSTDLISTSREARTGQILTNILYREAFIEAFGALAVPGGDRAARRLRPDRYQVKKKSTFVPFRRQR